MIEMDLTKYLYVLPPIDEFLYVKNNEHMIWNSVNNF